MNDLNKATVDRQIASVDIEACDAGNGSLELTILMPCLNEARTLATCIRKAQSFLGRTGISGEVLIADNGSSDGSQHIAESVGARVVRVQQRGYGAALLGGIAAARGRFVIMGDADDSYDFLALDVFVEALRYGNQLVMGNRFMGGIESGAMPFLNRYLGNPVLSFVGRLFFSSSIRDFHCGLRGFDRKAVMGLNLSTHGMEFASEMVVKAALADLKISEVPTRLNRDGRDRPPHLRRWSDGWRHLRFLLLFAPKQLFLYPGLVLMFFGVFGSGLLLAGSIRVGSVTLDTSSLLFAACAIMIGTQLCLFYGTAKSVSESVIRSFSKNEASPAPRYNLERNLIIGFGIFLIGIAIAILSVLYWGAADFKRLDQSIILRLTIPSATTMVVGLQIIFSAFLHSVLSITGKLE